MSKAEQNEAQSEDSPQPERCGQVIDAEQEALRCDEFDIARSDPFDVPRLPVGRFDENQN